MNVQINTDPFQSMHGYYSGSWSRTAAHEKTCSPPTQFLVKSDTGSPNYHFWSPTKIPQKCPTPSSTPLQAMISQHLYYIASILWYVTYDISPIEWTYSWHSTSFAPYTGVTRIFAVQCSSREWLYVFNYYTIIYYLNHLLNILANSFQEADVRHSNIVFRIWRLTDICVTFVPRAPLWDARDR